MKKRAQRAQEQNRARANPTGTTCLIGKPDIWNALPDALLLPPAPPGPPKHPRWVYNVSFPPKYKISRPQFPPDAPNSE